MLVPLPLAAALAGLMILFAFTADGSRTSRAECELHAPTKAPAVPMQIKRWNRFSITNGSQSESKLMYVKLNIETPCPRRWRSAGG